MGNIGVMKLSDEMLNAVYRLRSALKDSCKVHAERGNDVLSIPVVVVDAPAVEMILFAFDEVEKSLKVELEGGE